MVLPVRCGPWGWMVGLVLMVLALLAGRAEAAAVFLPGTLGENGFAPASGREPCYILEYCTISTAIDELAARTTITETLRGPEKAVTGVLLLPLPAGADGKSVSVTLKTGDKAAAPLGTARVLSAAEAQKLYETLAKGADAVGLVALTGKPAVVVSGHELSGVQEISLQFSQSLPEVQGVRMLDCPTALPRWSRGPVERFTLSATIRSGQPLRSIFSPSHEATITRRGLHEATVSVKADRYAEGDDFRLCFVADNDDLGLRILTFRDPADEEGYFMLLGNPSGSTKEEKAIPKDVLFVLDTSGSMRGDKIEQCRAAIEYCLGHLNAGDRFNVITFNTAVGQFRPEPVEASAANTAAAREFVDAIVASGNTNISEALARGLSGKKADGRPRIMIFLTDGTPTAGELSPDKIAAKVPELNAARTQIFVMGVGHDVNAHLLDKLAEATDGSSEYVAPEEEIDVKVAALYDRLSNPVLNDVAVSFGELATMSVYPRKLPALFKGSDVMILGQYRAGGTHSVTISGALNGEPKRYACSVEFPAKATAGPTDFVAPLWASRKIGFLLQEIRLHGENKEVIEEVVRLSRKFGIVTEYTAFIAAAGGRVDTKKAYELAKSAMGAANAEATGQWAVQQAKNDRELQNRIVTAPGSNVFRDRSGQAVATQAVRQIGQNTFYLHDGQWNDARDTGKRKERRVKLYSPEYFELVRKSEEFAKAQALGWAMSVNVGDERIVVEKDGKTADEQLKQNAPQMQEPMPANQFPQGEINQLQIDRQAVPAQVVPGQEVQQKGAPR